MREQTITTWEIDNRTQKQITDGYKGNAIIAYIDLLGFSDKIMNNWNEPSTLKTILDIKSFLLLHKEKNFKHYFFDYDETSLLNINLYPDIILFSDSFILIYKIDNFDENQVLLALLSVSATILEIWKISILNGYTIRGGIDLGDVFTSGSDIIGPTFINAYVLESKKANDSRVILSSLIMDFIKKNIRDLDEIISEYFYTFYTLENNLDLIIQPRVMSGKDSNFNILLLSKVKEMSDKVEDIKIKDKYANLIRYLEKGSNENIDRNQYQL